MFTIPDVHKSWLPFFEEEFSKKYIKDIYEFYQDKLDQNVVVYPPKTDIFNAFVFSPLYELKVVIIAQDPYISKGQAHGLAFSVPQGCKPPPSTP